MPAPLVLDTNTVMALWFFEDPALARLRHLIEGASWPLASRADAMEELRRVLAYPQFAAPAERQATLLADYRARIVVTAAAADETCALPACRDRDDQKFLEIARDSGASHLLTRDKALLKLARHRIVRARFAVLTPERYLAEVLPATA